MKGSTSLFLPERFAAVVDIGQNVAQHFVEVDKSYPLRCNAQARTIIRFTGTGIGHLEVGDYSLPAPLPICFSKA